MAKIEIRIDDELKANFKQLAKSQNRTMSGMVKHLMAEAIKKASTDQLIDKALDGRQELWSRMSTK